MQPTSDSALSKASAHRALDDWAYIVIDDTTYPCSVSHLGLETVWIDNVVVAVGERARLYVHLDDGNGGLMFLGLAAQVCWTNGHRAELALTRQDEDTRVGLLAWLDSQSAANLAKKR